MLQHFIKFFLENKVITVLLISLILIGGLISSPFLFKNNPFPQYPVPVDAIPDIGENQQIVFTKWSGRSPQDIEDQITYPLTTTLLGLPGVKTIRSSSMFGFSTIYLIFNDDVEFYWSRTRILEKLNSLPKDILPEGIRPSLGPDATALGQIFWYTLEGLDEYGNSAGGWDLQELRSIQDYQVRYALASVNGVAEVSSIGGYVKEYQVDIIPSAMQAYNINLAQIIKSIKNSNIDVGAKTIEINQVEYFVRGIGYIKNLEDLEESVVAVFENIPVRIKDIANISFGPAERRGVLDKEGFESVGGVVVARFGSNPLEVINNIKEKIVEIKPGLPEKILANGKVSKVSIVPFYDRTRLIKETLGTLKTALSLEILITILVIIVMVLNLRVSIIISLMLPIAVLLTFIAMKVFRIDANIVALSGIAIAIGTIVDVGIIITENILRFFKQSDKNDIIKTILKATSEVAPAIITAVGTTIFSFIPVFLLEGAEGKLFRPLAYTKTFILAASIIIGLTILPLICRYFLTIKMSHRLLRQIVNSLLMIIGIIIIITESFWLGLLVLLVGLINLLIIFYREYNQYSQIVNISLIFLLVSFILAKEWLPLGVSNSLFINYIFILIVVGIVLGFFVLFVKYYEIILRWILNHKLLFLSFPSSIVLFGLIIWLGFNSVFGFIATSFEKIGVDIRTTLLWSGIHHTFPGIGREFMPSLDEGSFLLMPTSMPHSGIEENKQILKQLDLAVKSIPEIEMVVGKLGRVESPLDPAPISMFENVINYKSEFLTDADGNRLRFALNEEGEYERDGNGNLIPDNSGKYFRQWRNHIVSPSDIWEEIVEVTKIPGVTSAPKLQPIETRLIMQQTGMRAPIGIKVLGDNLKAMEKFGIELEKYLQEISGVKKSSIFAERIVGKPYLELKIDRRRIAHYGLSIKELQKYIEVAIGGIKLNSTVEGRERYAIRARYPRDLRNSPETLRRILIPTSTGFSVPLEELINIEYTQGPQVIKSENSFLVSYITFDKENNLSEVDVVQNVRDYLTAKINNGELVVPQGISYSFTGNYENQVRSEKRLALIIPFALLLIMIILYYQFRSIIPAIMVFSAVLVAFSGGFVLIWFYGQEWFMNLSFLSVNIRDLFQMKTIYLSVAVWVGFLALFGIATDDGVIMTSYLQQIFKRKNPLTTNDIHEGIIEAGKKRIRPCLMTSVTTILALLPILTSSGRGSDVMIPMAIPIFGGMTISLITLFVVPVMYSFWKENSLKRRNDESK